MVDLRSKAGKAAYAAMRARLDEVDRLFRFERLELFVLEAEAGAFRLESGVVAGVKAGEVESVLQVVLLDDSFRAEDRAEGVVLVRHDLFSSRAAAERSARIWRAKFARMKGSEG